MSAYLEAQKALRDGRASAIGFGVKNLPNAPAQGVAAVIDTVGIPRYGNRARPAQARPVAAVTQAPAPSKPANTQTLGQQYGEYDNGAVGAGAPLEGSTMHRYDPNDFIDRGADYVAQYNPSLVAQEAPAQAAIPRLNTSGSMSDYIGSIQARRDARVNQTQQAAQAIEGTRQAGAERIESMREKGALSRVEREAALRREAVGEEREYGLPERESRIGESQARTKLLGTQEEMAQLGSVDAREYAHVKAQAEDEELAKTNPALAQKSRERLKAIEEKAMRQKIAVEVAKQKAIMGEELADGGEVKGYADGGAIGRSQTQQLNPLVAQYGQYLQAASTTGVSPVPFAQYINLLGSTRGAMGQTPTQFADGGDVSALNRPIEGPGTSRSDSIPAVIDGEQPAALSRGEFVIPEHVVRKKGTEFFEKLIAQYSEGAPANG